jgi:energy-coupling factor transport system permease protein
MLRDITIGQYYPVTSSIHRLDPRTKIIVTFFYIISLFLVNKYIGFALPFLFFVAAVLVSHVPIGYILKGLKPIMFIIMLTVIFNVFFGSGDALFKWGIICITKAGIKRGIFLAVRLILLMLGTSMLTFTTTPNQLTDGLESVFRPLNKLKVPVHEIAMMMSIALRFIPILLEETDKIMKAQQARGADFENGNIIKRAKSMIPIFIPLIISAFRRAFDLAMAMETRCYHGGEGRTKMKPMAYTGADYLTYVIAMVFIIVMVLIKLF